MHTQNRREALPLQYVLIDSLAQLVEHNTFNVGVMGSNPMRVTIFSPKSLIFSNLGFFIFKLYHKRTIITSEYSSIHADFTSF